MSFYFKKLNIGFLAIVSMMAVSCADKDVYDPDFGQEEKVVLPPNTFSFSTVQDVHLTVDYSAFELYGAVRFGLYQENPLIEDEESESFDENIRPMYENYTDENGKFDMNIKLPIYAKHLYVATGNFYVTQRVIEVDIVNGTATAVASNATRAITRAANRAAKHTDKGTTDVAMKHLWTTVDKDGNLKTEVFNEWKTWLGSWDAGSGAPTYLFNSSNSNLVFSSSEINQLKATVSDVLDINKDKTPYIQSNDLELDKNSEVAITMLKGNTCWNSTLGYYYYTGQPTSPKDVHVIMLFPNTQNGDWKKLKTNQSFNNNIGVGEGDVVQLMYYPNIASGSKAGATTVFPRGTKIGFVLKTNGWSMQGSSYALSGYKDGGRRYNVWAATTNNVSYCDPIREEEDYVHVYQNLNPTGACRAAKFSCTTNDGKKYAIISFEDACNDTDYDDVIFAVKPYDAFSPLPPDPEEDKMSTYSVYGFEDQWPKAGDYDMNDVIVDFEHEKVMSKAANESGFKVVRENFYLTTDQNYVVLKSGLAVALTFQKAPQNVRVKKIDPKTREETDITSTVKKGDNNVYFLTDDVTANLRTTYILTIEYGESDRFTKDELLASAHPFIYRDEDDGRSTWEVHVPGEAPTSSMARTYFGKEQDCSQNDGPYYVSNVDNYYPFAFCLYGKKLSDIHALVERKYEAVEISKLFPDFITWSKSNGANNTDWYLHMAREY